MNYPLLFRTVKHLKPAQVIYQVKNRLIKPAYVSFEAPVIEVANGLKTEPIARYNSWDGEHFTFLNLKHEFAGWNFTENGMLWAYNQNYFDWINQEGIEQEECCLWIDKFIEELPGNRIGLDPYPIALRSINWIKFFCQYPKCATKTRLDSLYSQLRLLEKKLEFHLLGNHLLEDAYALYIGSAFFHDERLLKKATNLLLSQLKEQVLPDGAHYEQSVMYHCILLDRLLDAINVGERCAVNGIELRRYVERMLGHLESIVWCDGDILMANDAAHGIAPMPAEIFDYARRLGIKWNVIPLKECGYRKLQSEHLEAIVDVGNITATYQPGHTHADSFNYELRIDGLPFVVDTGISTYNKTERRQLERSTIAHNTVSVDGMNSSEVWGGFRVGRRCHTKIIVDSMHQIEAYHNGFGKKCWRKFSMTDKGLVVEDIFDGEAVSYIHLAEGADINRVTIEGALIVDVKPWRYSTTYNQFHEGKVLEIHFKGQLRYTIQ